MVDHRRIQRLEKQILQTVAPLVSYGLKDPRLEFVTVTGVSLARDLSVAHVRWSVLDPATQRSKAEHALVDARGAIQQSLGRAMSTRTLPHLEFHYDESIEKAARVDEILIKLEKERAARQPEPPAESTEETETSGEDSVEESGDTPGEG